MTQHDEPGDVSRRDFLFGRLRAKRAAESTPAARPRPIPVHRPPGALPEAEFLDVCTRCGDCIRACPHDAIRLAGPRMRSAAGTPVIEVDTVPCAMCADLPCIASCAPGALLPQAPKKMATAIIETWACLAHQGTFCSVCSEQCPVPGAIETENGKPRINDDVCTGCGVCRYVCPAPDNAVLVMPLLDRPAPDGEDTP